jgi:hypothetical protein
MHEAGFSALCFSGGGIRSATFALGIVQSLAKHGLLSEFDYLSTVSGGGYLGSWLSAWIRREQLEKLENAAPGDSSAAGAKTRKAARENAPSEELELEEGKSAAEENAPPVSRERELFREYNKFRDDGILSVEKKLVDCTLSTPQSGEAHSPNPEPKQLQFLRAYSNFMSPKVGLLSADTWTLVGIYIRNLFLNWTIFIPLLCAILLIPRILLEFLSLAARAKVGEAGMLIILSIGLAAGIVAVISTVAKLPSKNPDNPENRFNDDAGVFLSVILPLLLMAFGATVYWAWYAAAKARGALFDSLPNFWGANYIYSAFSHEFANFVLFSSATFVLGNILYILFKKWTPVFDDKKQSSRGKAKEEKLVEFRGWEIVAAFVSSLVGGALTWLAAHNLFDTEYLKEPANLPLYLCFAVPLYLLCFSGGSFVFAGIYSRVATDSDREWLARQGAWIFISSAAWVALNGIVFFGTRALDGLINSFSRLWAGDSLWNNLYDAAAAVFVAVSGVLSLVGGFSGKSTVRNDQPNRTWAGRFLAVAPRLAAPVFLIFIFIGLAYISEFLLREVNHFLSWQLGAQSGGVLNWIAGSWLDFWIFCLIVLAGLGILMAWFINVNKFSLHAAYRDRLIRAYLGASHTKRRGDSFTGFDDTDNFQLHRLKGQKPFHVINATLNLTGGKKLAWQDRQAASFTMTPLHCGSWLLGYRNSNEYCRNDNLPTCSSLRFCNLKDSEPCESNEEGKCRLKGKALRLGTAMTISGAAANPNMGYYSSSVVTFLMSLFNIRLGWWLGNTGKMGDQKSYLGFGKKAFYTKPSPSVAILPLINETLGRTDEDKRFLNVTDGGHFENLGLYEMILRRCRFIILSDAAADEHFTYGEISNAIEKCKVDLGVDIKFNGEIKIYARSVANDYVDTRQRYAVAEIKYPEQTGPAKSYLLYIRPTFYGDEATDIKHYANLNLTFPHQTTVDEFYDEKQFEAYRALGFFTMETIIAELLSEEIMPHDLKNLPHEFKNFLKDLKIRTLKKRGRKTNVPD